MVETLQDKLKKIGVQFERNEDTWVMTWGGRKFIVTEVDN